MKRYYYFLVATSTLPTFYISLWELTNHVVLHAHIQIVKKEVNIQEEGKPIYYKFRNYLSNLCLLYNNIHFLGPPVRDGHILILFFFFHNVSHTRESFRDTIKCIYS